MNNSRIIVTCTGEEIVRFSSSLPLTNGLHPLRYCVPTLAVNVVAVENRQEMTPHLGLGQVLISARREEQHVTKCIVFSVVGYEN